MFLLTLFICALTDIVTYRIRNTVLIASAAAILLFDFTTGTISDPLSDLYRAIIVFIILIPFYAAGFLGAGDVKLIMVSAMYAGWESLIGILAGGVAASIGIVIMINRIKHEPVWKIKYPFAFALFIGALPVWF